MASTKYTYAHTKEVASAYSTLKEFREDHPALYAAAYRNWWLGDITEHMEVRRFWTEDEIFDAARPYKTELSSSKVTAEHTKLRGVVISLMRYAPI